MSCRLHNSPSLRHWNSGIEFSLAADISKRFLYYVECPRAVTRRRRFRRPS